MTLEKRVSGFERPQNPFSTACFGFHTENPVIRALDWLEKWHNDEKHVARGIKGHLTKGVRSRKERFGELLGRVIDGHLREPQDVVHVHTPYHSSNSIVSVDPKQNWKSFFTSKTTSLNGYAHKAYLMFDVPVIHLDNYKGRHYVMPDSVPLTERKIKALFIRKKLFSQEQLETILETCQSYSLPVFDLDSLEKI